MIRILRVGTVLITVSTFSFVFQKSVEKSKSILWFANSNLTDYNEMKQERFKEEILGEIFSGGINGK